MSRNLGLPRAPLMLLTLRGSLDGAHIYAYFILRAVALRSQITRVA